MELSAEYEWQKSLVDYLRELKAEGIPKEEYPRRIDRFLGRKAWFEGTPYSGQFELTPLCNLDCKMCYVHLNRAQMKEACLLSANQWKNLIDQAFDAGMRKATLTGGECLAYPGFDEIYLHLMSCGVRVTVLTNGVLLNQKRIEFFRLHPPAGIRVSLYGTDDDVYERVTGFAQADTVWNNVQLAKEAGLPLSISITPNRFMEADAEQLVEKVHSLGLVYVINTGLFEPREDTGRSSDEIDASIETYIRMFRKRKQLNGETYESVEPSSLPETKQCGEERVGIECGAGMNSFQISWNGEMYPCTNLRLFCAEPLKEGFKSSWEKLHEAVRKMALPVECSGCPYEEMCGPCVVPHIQNGKTDRCNPAICRRMRRFAAEGVYKLPDICEE